MKDAARMNALKTTAEALRSVQSIIKYSIAAAAREATPEAAEALKRVDTATAEALKALAEIMKG